MRRHQHVRNAEVARQIGGVQRAGTAEGQQREATRILAAALERSRRSTAMLVLTILRMPAAAVTRSRPSGLATPSVIARSARARSSVMRPPSTLLPPSAPSTRLASVTVGALPPRP